MVRLRTGAVVIGAGFAGLACARRLARAGMDFQVVEARDRIGGRAWTDYRTADGAPLELGAMMVHGRRVVTQACLQELGMRAEPILRLRAIRLAVDGRVAAMPWMALPFYRSVGPRRLYQGLVSIPRELAHYHGPDLSLDAYLDSVRPSRSVRALIELNHAHIFAMDPSDIGVLGPAEEARAAPEPWDYRNFRVVEGYSALAERFAAPFRPRIRLGTTVSKIRWDPTEPGVEVIAIDGSNDVVIEGRCAVVTLPVGVLKAGSVTFEPELPAEKQQAIERLAMADAFTVHVVLHGSNLAKSLGEPAFVWGGTPSTFFLPRASQTGGRKVVSAFTVGRGARARLRMSDRELAEVTMAELSEVLSGEVRTGAVESVAVHRWSLDSWARGAYSALPLGVGVDERRALAEPLEPSLFFAGEGTHVSGAASTVHGAIETGRRAAEELLAAASISSSSDDEGT